MTDLRPIAEATVGGLRCLLYPALAGEGCDLVVYAAGDARSLSGYADAWLYGARVVAGRAVVEIDATDAAHALSAQGKARALAWARREARHG